MVHRPPAVVSGNSERTSASPTAHLSHTLEVSFTTMQITVKTMQNVVFTITVELSNTVLETKAMIEAAKVRCRMWGCRSGFSLVPWECEFDEEAW